MVGAFSFVEVDPAPDPMPFTSLPRDPKALRLHLAFAADAYRLPMLERMPVRREPELGVDVPAGCPLDPRVIHGHGRP